MIKIRPDETVLQGRWSEAASGLEPDATSARIDELVHTQLKEIVTDPSGWDTLYRDPNDGRLWELTFPDSDSQGGGPPRLQCVDPASAFLKYGKIE